MASTSSHTNRQEKNVNSLAERPLVGAERANDAINLHHCEGAGKLMRSYATFLLQQLSVPDARL